MCFFSILNLKGYQKGIIGSKVTAILMTTSVCFTPLIFLNVLLLPFTKVKSEINRIQKDSLGKSYEKTLVSEFAVLAQKGSNFAAQFFFSFLSLQLIVDGSR